MNINLDNIIQDILKKRITELLTIIHNNCKTQFTKDDIQTELNIILEKIELLNQFQNNKCNTGDINNIISNNIISNNIISNNNIDTINNSNNNSNLCNARIWGKGIIYNIKTGEKVKKIPEKYNVTDFADINEKLFNKNFVIGCKCKRKKIDVPGSEYCRQHTIHLPHDNFTKPPDKELIFHYLKEGKYI